MNSEVAGTKWSLCGVALLAACACGASNALAKATAVAGRPFAESALYLPIVGVGSMMVVWGLRKRQVQAGWIGLGAITALFIGNLLTPHMSITAQARLGAMQLLGLFAYLAAGALLVWAFYSAYRFRNRNASMVAMTGAAMAVGCSCCLVTMGISGFAAQLAPWDPFAGEAAIILGQTATLYTMAAVLMAIGLFRVGGALPAIVPALGLAVTFFSLRLPNTITPMINGVRTDPIVKFPLMFAGAAMVMGAFVLAWRAERSRVAEPLVADPLPAGGN